MFTRTITLAAICAALGRGGTPAIQLFQGWALLGGHCWSSVSLPKRWHGGEEKDKAEVSGVRGSIIIALPAK